MSNSNNGSKPQFKIPNTVPSSYTPIAGQSNTVSSNRHNPLSVLTTIQIPVSVDCAQDAERKFNEQFKITTKYTESITIGEIIRKSKQYLNSKHSPLKFSVVGFSGQSFILGANSPNSLKNPLTNYNRNHLTDSGLNLQVILQKYEHKIDYTPITCEHMLAYHAQHNRYIPEKCPLYARMKNVYDYQLRYLEHLRDYTHFSDEFGDKPPCRYASECSAFQRLSNEELLFKDLCHIQMYRHPPRQNVINLKSNINPLLINTNNDQNQPIYVPTDKDKEQYSYDGKNGFLTALIREVIDNGEEECLQTAERYSLLSIVEEKLVCLRHRKMNTPLNKANMLALILYTGTECCYRMGEKQRKGDYETWKWFDYCLFEGIRKLSLHEKAEYKLYSGLGKVKLADRMVNKGSFKTYVSSSWDLNVSRKFIKGDMDGMIIVMDKEFRKHTYCCDVSWISKFQDECEVLISRSVGGGYENNFSLKVMDQELLHNIQIVSLFYNSN